MAFVWASQSSGQLALLLQLRVERLEQHLAEVAGGRGHSSAPPVAASVAGGAVVAPSVSRICA